MPATCASACRPDLVEYRISSNAPEARLVSRGRCAPSCGMRRRRASRSARPRPSLFATPRGFTPGNAQPLRVCTLPGLAPRESGLRPQGPRCRLRVGTTLLQPATPEMVFDISRSQASARLRQPSAPPRHPSRGRLGWFAHGCSQIPSGRTLRCRSAFERRLGAAQTIAGKRLRRATTILARDERYLRCGLRHPQS